MRAQQVDSLRSRLDQMSQESLTVPPILKSSSNMLNQYVEQRDGGYFIQGTRVSLDSLVYAFLNGYSPEGIASSFPALTLEQIYGALTFYLANQEMINSYLSDGRSEFESLRQDFRRNNPALYAKLAEAHKRFHALDA